MTAISAIAHPSAAAHHVFGSHMPHEWVLAFGQSCADLLAKHIEDPSTIKGGEHCESMIEMGAALAKMLPVGVPTFRLSPDYRIPHTIEDVTWAMHNILGMGFVTVLLGDEIEAVHFFNRSLAHESLSGLTVHFAFRDAGSAFVRLGAPQEALGAVLTFMAESMAVSVLGQRAAA